MNDTYKSKASKKNLLKMVSSFNDLTGLIQQTLISLKVLSQRAHRLKVGWDYYFFLEIKEALERNLRETEEVVNVISIGKLENSSNKDPTVYRELDGFSEDSKSGFGTYVSLMCLLMCFVYQGRIPSD